MLVFLKIQGFLSHKWAFLGEWQGMPIFSDFNLDKVEALP
jgi:hypothetical protein